TGCADALPFRRRLQLCAVGRRLREVIADLVPGRLVAHPDVGQRTPRGIAVDGTEPQPENVGIVSAPAPERRAARAAERARLARRRLVLRRSVAAGEQLEILAPDGRVRHECAALRLSTGVAVAVNDGTELAVNREANRAAETAARERRAAIGI